MPARKYHNKPETVDGIKFSSQREAKRYGELKLLVKAGIIKNLELQPRYRLEIGGKLICTYVGDFEYQEGGHRVCEDAKGMRTRDYAIKRKLFMAICPEIQHREV